MKRLRLSEYDIPRTAEAMRRAIAPTCTCDPEVYISDPDIPKFGLAHERECPAWADQPEGE